MLKVFSFDNPFWEGKVKPKSERDQRIRYAIPVDVVFNNEARETRDTVLDEAIARALEVEALGQKKAESAGKVLVRPPARVRMLVAAWFGFDRTCWRVHGLLAPRLGLPGVTNAVRRDRAAVDSIERPASCMHD